jgi:hypothetical protein
MYTQDIPGKMIAKGPLGWLCGTPILAGEKVTMSASVNHKLGIDGQIMEVDDPLLNLLPLCLCP